MNVEGMAMNNKQRIIKYPVFILALLLLLTGCTKGDSDTVQPANESKSVDFPDLTQSVSNVKTDEVEPEPPVSLGFEITNEDVFEKGYYSTQYNDFSSADIYFESNNEPDSDIEWRVYITDEEVGPDEMEELLSQQPVAVNSGSSHIVNGQWIYIICNINSETADEPAESSFSSYSVRDYI